MDDTENTGDDSEDDRGRQGTTGSTGNPLTGAACGQCSATCCQAYIRNDSDLSRRKRPGKGLPVGAKKKPMDSATGEFGPRTPIFKVEEPRRQRRWQSLVACFSLARATPCLSLQL